MHYALLSAALAATASAHGLVLMTMGDNGVKMAGLSVADGTPRDCTSNRCGAQADTAIIREREIQSGRASPLGRTQGNGPVDPNVVIGAFMGNTPMANVPTNNGASGAVGQEDDLSMLGKGQRQKRAWYKRQFNRLLGAFGLGGAGAAGARPGNRAAANGAAGGNNRAGAGPLGALDGLGGAAGAAGGLGGLLGGVTGGGGNKNNGPPESMIASTWGMGSEMGLPTADDNGEVTVIYRQVNQDGAGGLTAAIDPTSGGTSAAAFQNAQVTQNVPGTGIGGLSLATNTDYPVKVKMPPAMTCDGKVGGAENVCIVRLANSAAAGPFGGAAAFTQNPTARKRAIAYRLRKRMEFNRS